MDPSYTVLMMKKLVHNPLHRLSWNGEALVKQRRYGQTQVYPEVFQHYNLSPIGYLNKLCKFMKIKLLFWFVFLIFKNRLESREILFFSLLF